MKITSLLFILMLFFSSCSSEYDNRLKVSATTWIGYTPLFYAKEKGWLEPINVKLINVSSLAENMYLYKAGNSDAYAGTQYEYKHLSSEFKSLKPIMMFDRSNGGDLIMSNLSVEELQKLESKIDIYLEIDSINKTLIDDFIATFNLKEKDFNFLNRDQTQIENLKATSIPTLIATYIPYNLQLEKNGFKEIASTKDNLKLLVVDALFTKNEIFNKHKTQFKDLKNLVNRAVSALEKDPKEFYETIKPYILEIDYEEFQASLGDIVWINDNLSDELKTRMHKSGLPIRDLL